MKIGDYVRLDRCQGINKIEEFDEDINKYKLEDIIGDEWGDETFILDENDVIKSSSNIIDLIEVGDYVNGFKVLKILSHNLQLIFVAYKYNGHHYTKILDSEDIKSIVTKEQFKMMEYRIGE